MVWGMRSPLHTPRIIILTLLDPPGRRRSIRQCSLLGPPSPPQQPQYFPCSRPKVPKSQRGKDLAGVPWQVWLLLGSVLLGVPKPHLIAALGLACRREVDPHFLWTITPHRAIPQPQTAEPCGRSSPSCPPLSGVGYGS